MVYILFAFNEEGQGGNERMVDICICNSHHKDHELVLK